MRESTAFSHFHDDQPRDGERDAGHCEREHQDPRDVDILTIWKNIRGKVIKLRDKARVDSFLDGGGRGICALPKER